MDQEMVTTTARRVIKNTGLLLLGNIVNRLCTLAFLVIAARHIGVVGLGKYTFALSFAALFMILGDWGVNAIAVREVARDGSLARKYLGNIVVLKMLLSATLLGIIFMTVTLLDYPLDTTKIVYIIGISIFFSNFCHAVRWSFHAFQKMEYDALLNITGGILLLALGLIALYLGKGLIGLALAHCFTSIFIFCFSFLITVKKFGKPKFEIDWNLWKYLIPTAIPIGLVTIFSTIYANIDTVMLSLIKGDAPVGWYNAGVKLVKILELIPSMYGLAIFPVMASFYKTSIDSLKKVFRKSMQYMFLLAAPIAIGTTVLSHEIIFMIWGPGFSQTAAVLQILVWRGALLFLSTVAILCLYTIDKQKIPMNVCAIGVIINVVLNLILIPKFSYIGAGIATVITEFIVTPLLFFFVFKILGVNPFPPHTFKIVVASLVMGAVTWLIMDFNVIFVVLVSVILYFGILFAWKVVDYKEIRGLIRV